MKSNWDAIQLCQLAHAGQVDKLGAPYWQHPMAVADLLMMPTRNEYQAALLHDVVEDTDYTLEDLRVLGYSEETVEIVRLVTKAPSRGGNYMDYIHRIKDSGNHGAIRVKIADLKHNLGAGGRGVPTNWGAKIERMNKALVILEGTT